MESLKKLINIVVMLYLVAATLIFLGILNVGQDTNPGFYTTFFIAGGVIMLLELIIENLYIMMLRRGQVQTQQKITELKANLYDHKQELQDIKIKQAQDPVPVATTQATVPPTTAYTTTTAPISAAPTGTDPIPQVVKPVPDTATHNPNVIITPSPTPGIQDPERRLPENTDY